MRSAEATVRSFTSKTAIRNNAVASIGSARLGVMRLKAGPSPIMRIAVMPDNPTITEEGQDYDVHGFLNRLRRYPDQLDRILANDLD